MPLSAEHKQIIEKLISATSNGKLHWKKDQGRTLFGRKGTWQYEINLSRDEKSFSVRILENDKRVMFIEAEAHELTPEIKKFYEDAARQEPSKSILAGLDDDGI